MHQSTAAELSQICANLHFRLELLAKTRRHTDRLLATRFNVFDYIQPDENQLSDVIADILHPGGKHGQGDAFLREFIVMVCGPTMPFDWNFVSIRREHTTSFIESRLRRMDILVHLKTCGIAIENKPWAGEQHLQIHDYVAHLERAFAGKFVIVYLSPQGTKPTSIGEDFGERLMREGRLLLCAYNGRFLDWLARCHQICAAEKIRVFLSDLMAYVRQTFPSENLASN